MLFSGGVGGRGVIQSCPGKQLRRRKTVRDKQTNKTIRRGSINLLSAGSHARGGDATVYVMDKNQPSLPIPFYSVLVSISVFVAFSTVFHTINSPGNSPLSHSVLLVLFLPHWPFQLYIYL